MLNNVSWLRVSARPLITDVTTHRAPSLDGFQHFRFYCSNFAVKYLLIIADILVITYTGELMFNIMICNITKIRIRLSICTSSEVVLSSICSLSDDIDIRRQCRVLNVRGNILFRKFHMCSVPVKLKLFNFYCSSKKMLYTPHLWWNYKKMSVTKLQIT